MKKILLISLGLLIAAPAAQAENALEWLNSTVNSTKKAIEPADAASLLTLENKESEMYPLPAPGGKYFLTLSQQGKQTWISRRLTENGDPVNMVTDDVRTVESVGWKDDGHIYYLSERAGGLGLWEKISDGEGMQRRIQSLHGSLTQPVLLPDESIIVVRARALNYKKTKMKKPKLDTFNNWEFPGFATEIVRIKKGGSQQVLAEGINPALSPDGAHIVFSMQAGRSMHLFRMNTDGSDLIQVTDARSIDVQPSWSADGKWIIFTSNRANADMRHRGKSQWDVWAIGTDGRNLTQITFDEARDGAARMGIDGRIYFHSDRAVSKEVRQQHQVKSVKSHSFHIWAIAWPSKPGQ